MCGISGFFRTGSKSPAIGQVEGLLTALQSRGMEATGIAWMRADHIAILKSPGPATTFINLPAFKKVIPEAVESPWLLLHTRLASHGSPKNNLNNHPIYNQKGLIIHNGIVYPQVSFPAQGETDTEQILLSIQNLGWVKGINNLTGSLAIAYVNVSAPQNIYLYAHGIPIHYGWDGGLFAFASTEDILMNSQLQFNSINQLPSNTLFSMNGELRKQKYIKPRRGDYEGFDWQANFNLNRFSLIPSYLYLDRGYERQQEG